MQRTTRESFLIKQGKNIKLFQNLYEKLAYWFTLENRNVKIYAAVYFEMTKREDLYESNEPV